VLVSVTTVLVNVGLNLTLVRIMGFQGLALGTSVSALVNAGVLLWLLRSRLGGLDQRRVGDSFARIGAASLVMGLAAWAADAAIASWLPSRTIPVMALRVASSITVALIVLDQAARLLQAREFNEARAMVLARMRWPTRRA
jgi:putative peptidoglycan lipid II flippase